MPIPHLVFGQKECGDIVVVVNSCENIKLTNFIESLLAFLSDEIQCHNDAASTIEFSVLSRSVTQSDWQYESHESLIDVQKILMLIKTTLFF